MSEASVISPDIKSDATKVCDILSGPYERAAKRVVTDRIVLFLKQHDPQLVGDFWSGGRSARRMVAEGLQVLSIDNFSALPANITLSRALTAAAVNSTLGKYGFVHGDAIAYLDQCDAAWLDFMGHMSAMTWNTLRACRHMKAVAVTLMPERTAVDSQGMPLEGWVAMMSGFVQGATEMKLKTVLKYERGSNKRVIVFLLERDTYRKWKKDYDKRRYISNPIRRVSHNAPRTDATRKVARVQRAALMADPEYRAQKTQQQLESRHRAEEADPAKAELRRAKARLRHSERMQDPEYRVRRAEAQRQGDARRKGRASA